MPTLDTPGQQLACETLKLGLVMDSVGIAIKNNQFLIVYTTRKNGDDWGWLIIAIQTLGQKPMPSIPWLWVSSGKGATRKAFTWHVDPETCSHFVFWCLSIPPSTLNDNKLEHSTRPPNQNGVVPALHLIFLSSHATKTSNVQVVYPPEEGLALFWLWTTSCPNVGKTMS